MKYTVLSAALALAAAFAPAALAQDNTDIENKYPGFKLAYHDEFDAEELDMNQWTAEIGFKRNNEDQWYTDKNFELRDGNLVITAKKERFKNPDYNRFGNNFQKRQYVDYTSASLIAKQKFHYGIYEMRAKIPVGTGYWPAYWACGNSREWPNNGEIDMLEYYGDAIHANVAWGSTKRWNATWSSSAPRMNTFDADFADKFHVWRMEFDYDAIRLYIDDRLLNETSLDRTVNPVVDYLPGDKLYNPYRDEYNLFDAAWVNLALGGNNGGSLANTAFPAEYIVDYVRVYTNEDIYSVIKKKIPYAQDLLDTTLEGNAPGQYTAEAREALAKAIADVQALIDVADEEGARAGSMALENAMNVYRLSVNPVVPGDYRFAHKATDGLMLSTGWYENNNCVLLLNDNRVEGADSKDYNQVFTLEEVPEEVGVSGFYFKVGESEYVYRNSWNLFVSSEPNLTSKDYIFNIEFDGKYVHIKNEGSGKYFGNDDNWAWVHVYSDKAGKGNEKSYFTLIQEASTGVQDIIADNGSGVSAVYNLQGVRVADSVDELIGRGNGQVYIVAGKGKSQKVIIR